MGRKGVSKDAGSTFVVWAAVPLLGLLCACSPLKQPVLPEDDAITVEMQGVVIRRYHQGRLELQARADQVLLFGNQKRVQARQVAVHLEGDE